MPTRSSPPNNYLVRRAPNSYEMRSVLVDAVPEFVHRHVGLSDTDRTTMLRAIGQDSVEALLDAATPPTIRTAGRPHVPFAPAEAQMLTELREIAAKNAVPASMGDRGYNDAATPSVSPRHELAQP